MMVGVLSGFAQTLADALDTTNLVWTTGGDAAWFVQTTNTYDGVDAVQSGSIDSNKVSWIETTIQGPATISYWSKRSFGVGALSLVVTVNGRLFDPGNGRFPEGWFQEIYDLGEGLNVIRWSAKDYFGGANNSFVAFDEFTVGPPRPLTITYQPYDKTVYSGGYALMSVDVIGTPPIQFQWFKDSTVIPGATNSYLYFEQATTNDAGVYSVVVSNATASLASSNAIMTIQPPSPPFFNFEPQSLTAYESAEVTLWANVDGSPPFTFQWRKDGTNLPDANWSFLTLTDISQADAGNYTLIVSNEFGNVESTNATLTVLPSSAPIITQQPRSLQVAAGVNTWMSVAAVGTPDPYYSWMKLGDPLPPNPPGPRVSNEQSRFFRNVGTNDAGVYFATASNLRGDAISWDALLTVLPPLKLKGSWGQGAEGLFITNQLVFLAQGAAGLGILSVSNPAAPVLLGAVNTPGYASAVSVLNGTAYVADGASGIQIINVTNPFAPFLAGKYPTAGYASDVVVRSNLAYVADQNGGLLILNVGNPTTPTAVGSFSTNLSPDHICLSGNYVFLTSLPPAIIEGSSNYFVGGLLIIDVSNPAHPVEVGRLAGSFGKVAAHEQLVFTDTQVISITNPAQPVVIGGFGYTSTNYPSTQRLSGNDVGVVNNLAYLTGVFGDQFELVIFDTLDASQPIPVGYFTMAGRGSALRVDGNFVYVAGYDTPLLIIETPFNVQSTGPPTLSLDTGNGLNLQVQGRTGFHYEVECADQPAGFPWQPLQTVLLTNQNQAIPLPFDSRMKFFRLRQLD